MTTFPFSAFHPVTLRHCTPRFTTTFVLYSSIAATLLLLFTCIAYHFIIHPYWYRLPIIVLTFSTVYLGTVGIALRGHHIMLANWMLISYHTISALCALLLWGINTTVGILALGFAVILPSKLVGSQSVLPVISAIIAGLIAIHLLHSLAIITPDRDAFHRPAVLWDVIVYSTLLFLLATVSWVSGVQRETYLRATKKAERALLQQKEDLRSELEKESSTLRLAQLRQTRQLHKFALLGQTSAATLHELSSHLSVLNLDINDLREHRANSKAISRAIANAQESIEHINKTVRQAKQQLSSYDKQEPFNALPIITQSIQDTKDKLAKHHINFIKQVRFRKNSFIVKGNRMALMQIITIILNNAIDACYDIADPEITLSLEIKAKALVITIQDNGLGVPADIASALFLPVKSSKPTGMGVGLYIARHLAENHFKGTLVLEPSSSGARFSITIPG